MEEKERRGKKRETCRELEEREIEKRENKRRKEREER